MKAKTLIAEFRIRSGRGQAIFNDIKSALMIATAVKILFNTSLITTILSTASVMVGFFIIGFIDFKWIKSAQEEARLSTSKYNPHLNKLGKLK